MFWIFNIPLCLIKFLNNQTDKQIIENGKMNKRDFGVKFIVRESALKDFKIHPCIGEITQGT